ncbi:MAG: cell envelope integrity EipB family protein [Xanthobacteraceae bacterium]
MTSLDNPAFVRLLRPSCVAVLIILSLGTSAWAAETDELASHRAVYELSLAQSRGSSTVGARGRILYDFSGSACEGYALQFRQVSEMDNGEGRVTLSDLRTTTWEDSGGKTFVFKSENYLNQSLIESVEGRAERLPDKVVVKLLKPVEKTLELDATTAFPTDHMRRIIAAGRAGKSILEVPVYDGSEKGERIYQTLSVIGRTIAPNERPPSDAEPGHKALAGLERWPVTVSYFDKASSGGDQSPIYAIKFEVYGNGVSRALVLDYNDFSIRGDLTSLDMRETRPCNGG